MRVSLKPLCLLLFLYCGVLTAQDIDAGLRIHLDFNDNMRDLTGIRTEGTLLDARYGLDRFGNCQYALCFNEYLQLAEQDDAAWQGLQDFSFSLWFRTDDNSFHTMLSVANTLRNNEVNLNVLTTGILTSNIRNQANVPGIRIEGTRNVADGQWHHVVMTRDGTTGNTFIYVDGVQDGFKQMPLGVIETGPGGFVFGNDQDCLAGCYDPNQQFNGALDDFRLYDRVISTDEIAALFAYTDGLVDNSPRGSRKDMLVCDDSAVLSVERAFDSFEWNTGSLSEDITVTESGQYIVTGLIKDCEYKDTIDLRLNQLPNIEIMASATDLSCESNPVITASLGFDRYEWQDGSTGAGYTVISPGRYSVTGFSDCGQTVSNEIEIIQSILPVLELTSDREWVGCGEQIEISATSGFASYTWSNGGEGESVVVSGAGLYEVRAIDICGNEQVATINIPAIEYLPYFIPNAFTPNGDGKNEVFEIDDRLIGVSMKIYDRWGKEVFATSSYQNDWDGADHPADSYFIVINSPCLIEPLKNWVKILR